MASDWANESWDEPEQVDNAWANESWAQEEGEPLPEPTAFERIKEDPMQFVENTFDVCLKTRCCLLYITLIASCIFICMFILL